MATDGNYALFIPASLMEDLRVAAERESVSMNAFIVQAVAEKVAMLRALGVLESSSLAQQAAYLQARAARAVPGGMASILAKAGTPGLMLPGDEVPEGWLNADAAVDDVVQDNPTPATATRRAQSVE